MTKEFLIKIATGFIAKGLRYLITSAGAGVATEGAFGSNLDVYQIAAGVATIGVTFGWSMWEDRVKARAKAKADAEKPAVDVPKQ